MSLQPGDKVGAFRLIRELGRGATGTVYLAEQASLGRECALKVLAPELIRDSAFLERFRREGMIAASLRHNNIVRIFDLVEDGHNFAIVMDYIEGQELRELVAEKKKLPLDVALDIIGHTLEALEYAHNKGVVHRDIKPANIMIETDGSVFLTDFSIARMAGTEKLTKTGMVIGTPEYMAPEQFDGKEVDARADVYATALILYEILTGVNPFCGETLAEIIKKQVLVEPPSLDSLVDCPGDLAKIVHRGLRKSPDERYQSAAEMRRELLGLGAPMVEAKGSLTQFLSSVELGAVSMDDAVIARDMVKDAIDKGFKRRLSIVMLDLAGSSKIKIPNQTLVADRAFQDYRGTINRILEEHGCERYDWSGDGAISLFSDPVQAVDAAVKVQRTVAQVGERHQSLPDALKVRIGIRTGLVYYDPRRTLGEFASRTVDQAGHLEKDCPPGSIRLGDETVKALGDRYSLTSIGVNRDDIEVFEIDVHSEGNACCVYAAPTPSPKPLPEPALRSPLDPPIPPRRDFSTNEPSPEPKKELFRPKSESGQLPSQETKSPETEAREAKTQIQDEMPWWGWKSLGFLFISWASFALLGVLAPGIRSLGLIKIFAGLFKLHLLATPLYCFYYLYVGESQKAKESITALAVFVGVALMFVGILTAAAKSSH